MQKNDHRLMQVSRFSNKTLDAFCLKTAQQQAVLDVIKAALPHSIKPHISHCVTGADKLVVYTDSAAWATQLRFYSKAILDAANGHLSGNVSTVRVKILPNVASDPPIRKPLIPNRFAVEKIKSHGETVSDPQLKASLMRLSATLLRLQQDKPVS